MSGIRTRGVFSDESHSSSCPRMRLCVGTFLRMTVPLFRSQSTKASAKERVGDSVIFLIRVFVDSCLVEASNGSAARADLAERRKILDDCLAERRKILVVITFWVERRRRCPCATCGLCVRRDAVAVRPRNSKNETLELCCPRRILPGLHRESPNWVL